MFWPVIFVAVLTLAIYAALRIIVFTVTALIYDIRFAGYKQCEELPYVTVVIPAYNEEKVIEATVLALAECDYPEEYMQIIVANDGSKDATAQIVQKLCVRGVKFKLRMMDRPNAGKAEAMNWAIRNAHAPKDSLIMCLDADSIPTVGLIRNVVKYFDDPDVVAVATNVNIAEHGTLLYMAQRLEYLMSHFHKRAHSLLGTEYIVGGVGSTFRANILQKIKYYDSNTMTEDIDLTMKIVRLGRPYKVMFAADAITYTAPVKTFWELVKQRMRWKYGRLQTFWKNRNMFFSRNKKQRKQLTYYMLPSALFYECLNLLEPVMIALSLYLLMAFGDYSFLLVAIGISTSVCLISIWCADHLCLRDKLTLSCFAPMTFLYMCVMTACEYFAAMQCLRQLPQLKKSISDRSVTWTSPTR